MAVLEVLTAAPHRVPGEHDDAAGPGLPEPGLLTLDHDVPLVLDLARAVGAGVDDDGVEVGKQWLIELDAMEHEQTGARRDLYSHCLVELEATGPFEVLLAQEDAHQ